MKSRTPTKAEKEWMNKLGEFGCIVCFNHGILDCPASIHHIEGRVKKGAHFLTLPLCGQHHQGDYGIGLHSGKAEWEKRYGTQMKLLNQLCSLLGKGEISKIRSKFILGEYL